VRERRRRRERGGREGGEEGGLIRVKVLFWFFLE